MDIVKLIFIYCPVGLATVLLGWDWWRHARRGRFPWTLILVTLSCLWTLLGVIWSPATGAYYSPLRGYAVDGNLLCCLIVVISSGLIPSQRSWRKIIAALLLGYLWSLFIIFPVV